MTTIPLSEQIAEIKRELAVRRNVYASWVRQMKMTQPQADKQIARMQAALETLEEVEAYGIDYGSVVAGPL